MKNSKSFIKLITIFKLTNSVLYSFINNTSTIKYKNYLVCFYLRLKIVSELLVSSL